MSNVERAPRPLVMKMARVMAQVERIPKNGYNAFHKYDYVMEADLVELVRTKLAEQHIAIFPSVRDVHTEEVKGGRQANYLTTVVLDITLIDGETGDSVTISWVGRGADAGEKGVYKAYTGAIKYFLMKTFLIPTGDDPERETEDRQPQRSGGRRSKPSQRRASRGRRKPQKSEPAKGKSPQRASPSYALAKAIFSSLADVVGQGRAGAVCKRIAAEHFEDSLRELSVEQLEGIQQEIKHEGVRSFVERTLARQEEQHQAGATSSSDSPPDKDDPGKDDRLKDEPGQGRPTLPPDAGDVPGIGGR